MILAKLVKAGIYLALLERGGVDSIPANSDAQNMPSFHRWQFEMKLSPFFFWILTIRNLLKLLKCKNPTDCPAGPKTDSRQHLLVLCLMQSGAMACVLVS